MNPLNSLDCIQVSKYVGLPISRVSTCFLCFFVFFANYVFEKVLKNLKRSVSIRYRATLL